MEHEYLGACGLRERLRLAYEDVADIQEFAELLDITPDSAHSIIYDDSFTPTDEEQANAWANLFLVANIYEHAKRIGAGNGREITAWLSALWTPEAMADLSLSNFVREIAWVF
jgi:hypothetical protein